MQPTFLGPMGYGPTGLRCANMIKHIRARICEYRLLGSSHHVSNMCVCSYSAI